MAGIRQLLGGCLIGIGAMACVTVSVAQDLAPLPVDARQITDSEMLRDLMGDATFYNKYLEKFGEVRVGEYFCRNGKSIYVEDHGFEQGSWWTKETQVCIAYGVKRKNRTVCRDVYELADGHYLLRSEANSAESQVGRIAGDPFQMRRYSGMTCEDLSS